MHNIERPKCDFLKSKTISFDTSRLSRIVFRDHIKGLKLRHFGKLNFTYHSKLRHRSRQETFSPPSTAVIAAIYIVGSRGVSQLGGMIENLVCFSNHLIYKCVIK